MRIVNIYPNQNALIKLPDWEISSPVFNAALTNQEIYKCINQKASVYEIIDGNPVLITLVNIKKDLEQEAEAEAEAKKSEIEKLKKTIEDLRRQLTDIKEDHIFQSYTEGDVYAKSAVSVVGETIAILSDDKSKYNLYIIEPNKSLAPVGSDESTQVQSALEKLGQMNVKVTQLSEDLIGLNELLNELKNKSNIFETITLAEDYAKDATKSKPGEIISININSKYAAYTINTDRTISPLVSGIKVRVIQ